MSKRKGDYHRMFLAGRTKGIHPANLCGMRVERIDTIFEFPWTPMLLQCVLLLWLLLLLLMKSDCGRSGWTHGARRWSIPSRCPAH